jgi:hypothetical protein
MAKRRLRRYFWALHFAAGDPELAGLSAEAREGLAYATELAEDARERSRLALEHGAGPATAPLTATELAWRHCLPLVEVRRRIKLARVELFGRDLSDSAISYRLRKRRQHGPESVRSQSVKS